jgi:hypothetical protein
MLANKHDEKELAAVVVWDGKARKGDITNHFKTEAIARGFTIHEINTLTDK